MNLTLSKLLAWAKNHPPTEEQLRAQREAEYRRRLKEGTENE